MERIRPAQETKNPPSRLKILVERFVLAGAITFGIFGIGSSLYEVASTREGPRIESGIKSEGLEVKEKELRAILKTYPESWVRRISSIKQSETELRELSPLSNYGVKGYEIGALVKLSSSGKYRLFISDTFAFLKTQKMVETLSHEIAHAGFSAELLDKILLRLEAEDRFKSPYVESIKNPDKGTETAIKVQEYWAEICKQYFDDAESLDKKDFEIIEERIKKEGPGFDWRKAREERQKIIAAGKQEEQEERREILGLNEVSVSDELRSGKLILNFNFTLKGSHFKTELEGDAKFLGQKGTIHYRTDGFVYSREMEADGKSEFLSFFFAAPEGEGSKIKVSETTTMREIKEAEAIS